MGVRVLWFFKACLEGFGDVLRYRDGFEVFLKIAHGML